MNFRSHKFSGVVAFLAILFLWMPLVIVAVNSLNGDILLARWGGATLTWYRAAFESEDVREGLRSTIAIALGSTALSLVFAVSGALWWRRASPLGRRLFDLLTYLRILLPEVVFAVAMFLLFTRFRFPLGLAAVVIGHTVWNSAYATLIVQARLGALDPALEDAAADLGAGPGGVFRRVTVPGLMPSIVAAGLLTFTFSFDDIVTSYFLAGSDIASPLPLVILSLIRQRIGPQINAIGMLVMVATVTILAVGTLATRGSWRSPLPKGRAEPLRRDPEGR
jgi:ABC-type spermidine/putrescine transport system permease subunit II